MPNWGLTAAARQTKPYGLDPWWLQPGKVITDPVHGDVFVMRLEQLLLDTPPMQRLRRVRQLGTTHLVYPGATHTRLSHSLGAVRVVQTLLDVVIDQRNRNHQMPDLFEEWEQKSRREAEELSEAERSGLPLRDDEYAWQLIYRRRVAEVTVLARLGALLHDIGHLPFGHTIEDDLRLLVPHDESTSRFASVWDEVMASWTRQVEEWATQDSAIAVGDKVGQLDPLRPDGKLFVDLRWLVLSSQKDEKGNRIHAADRVKYPFVADMVGNTICADLLDYLERDHIFTGLPVSLGTRYLSSFYITSAKSGGIYTERMALVIAREGRERKDIITEILKHLRFRYELQERVLVHHTKLAADAMVGKMFEFWLKAAEEDLAAHPRILAGELKRIPEDFKVPDAVEGPDTATKKAARFKLEEFLLRYGDDGVLERIADPLEFPANPAAKGLAASLLNRDLYKPAANAAGAAAAEDLHTKFGSHEERRRLEEAACTHAGIKEPWHVVLWLPDPNMRLKLAELLVNDGQGVAKFKDKSQLGSDIYAAHKDLWTISVFVHPSVSPAKRAAVLARLGQILGVSWDRYFKELGDDPATGPEHLAAARALNFPELTQNIHKLMSIAASGELAARGGAPETQQQLNDAMGAIAEEHGLAP